MASVQGQRSTVLPVGGQGVQTVHRGEDSGAQRDLFCRQAKWIAVAIPSFVVRFHDGRHGIREIHLLENLGAHQRMDFHLLEFLRRQFTGFGDDVLRHGQLPDVMQQRGGSEGVQLFFGKAHLLADLDRIMLHPPEMLVSSLILGFNRQSQRFDGADMQSIHLFHVLFLLLHTILLCLQAADVETV